MTNANICAVRHDHPIAQQTELTLEQFCQLEQALISYHGSSFSGVTDQALQAMGLQPIGTKLYCLA